MKNITKKLFPFCLSVMLSAAVIGSAFAVAAPFAVSASAESSIALSLATETPSDYELTYGADYDIGASVASGGDSLVDPIISITITNGNGETEFTLAELPESYIYCFENTGAYTLAYTVMDNGVAVYTRSVDVSIKRTYYRLNNIAKENIVSYGDENAVSVSQNSVYIFDAAYGANFYDVSESNIVVSMMVKKPNASAYTELTSSQKTQGYIFEELFGEYAFTYAATYQVNGETYSIDGVSFTVELVDGTNPTLYLVGENYLKNAVYESDSEDGKTTYYKALVNQALTFGKMLASDEIGTKTDLTSDISWSVYCDGTLKRPLEICGNTDGLSYISDECGEYIFAFSVEDDFGNRDYHYVVVQVCEYLYELMLDFRLRDTYSTEEQLVFNGFTVVDHIGEEVLNITKKIIIEQDGETLLILDDARGNFAFETSGVYSITYQALKNGETVCEESFAITVEDKTAPHIVISGEIGKSGTVGSSIKLPSVMCTDNETVTTCDITITLDGKWINHYKGSFKPMEKGTYVVMISARDLNGNVSTYSYEVEVFEEIANVSWIGWTALGAGCAILAFTIVVLMKKRKNKR